MAISHICSPIPFIVRPLASVLHSPVQTGLRRTLPTSVVRRKTKVGGCTAPFGTLWLPLCPPPWPVPRKVERTKEITKERQKESPIKRRLSTSLPFHSAPGVSSLGSSSPSLLTRDVNGNMTVMSCHVLSRIVTEKQKS